ncbi:hypothetical protein Tco_0168229 [Tanacetum coccineum]
MSTSKNSNQQTFADSRANERPLMLERVNYIPWESIFRRPMIPDPNGAVNINSTVKQILESLSKMTVDNKKQYIADVKVMNYLLQAIPNDIYNSVDASKGESLEFVYERLTMLVNIMDRNNIVSYDMLYDSFVQFEPHVLASKAKKAAKNHDPLSLIVHSNASSSQSHAHPSYSPQPYYVTHPSSVVDYEDEYQGELQGDSQEDKLITVMMLLARAITQKFSTPTNTRYGGNSNKNAGDKAGIERLMQEIEMMTAIRLFSVFHELSQLRERQIEQMLLAMKDEVGSNLNNKENDFMLETSYGEETMEELTAAIMLMARIPPTDGNAETLPSYDAKAVSEDKLRTIDKGNNVNTKFDKSEASGTLLCVTPLPKNIAIKAKKVSKSKVNADRSKPVTSHPTPTNEQESSNSVRRQKSKDTKSKNSVLKNTNAKSLTAHVQKMSCSVSIDSNKNSCVKRALFTIPVAAKSKNLGTTFVVAKSRLGVANIPKATNKVLQIVLWIVDSGCSKHMTGNLQLLRNFNQKFIGTVCFRNDYFAGITGYEDYVLGNLTICHVYYVEGLRNNLFLVGQFCDGDLEVAFRSNTCYVRNLKGDD